MLISTPEDLPRDRALLEATERQYIHLPQQLAIFVQQRKQSATSRFNQIKKVVNAYDCMAEKVSVRRVVFWPNTE